MIQMRSMWMSWWSVTMKSKTGYKLMGDNWRKLAPIIPADGRSHEETRASIGPTKAGQSYSWSTIPIEMNCLRGFLKISHIKTTFKWNWICVVTINVMEGPQQPVLQRIKRKLHCCIMRLRLQAQCPRSWAFARHGRCCCCRLLFMISGFVSAASWRLHPVLDVVLRRPRMMWLS